MSMFATNFTVDENTGEVKLIKHLNKIRIDRNYSWGVSGGWNKNGKKARRKKQHMKGSKKRIFKIIKKEMNKE